MFTSKQYVHHHRSQWKRRGKERAGGSEERKSKLQVSPSERRNLALRTTFAYRFHMRHVESFSQPHPLRPSPWLLHPLSNANTIHFEYFRGAKRVAQIVWNNHENVYMSDVFFLPFWVFFCCFLRCISGAPSSMQRQKTFDITYLQI